MAELSPSVLRWHTSQASGNADCVEVAACSDRVLVRHSKDRSGPVLTFTPSEWAAFLAGVRSGEFDLG